MTDFLGANESLADDLEDLLLLDLEDLRIEFEEPVEMTDDEGEEDGFAHCFIVFRRNLFLSFCELNPEGFCCNSGFVFTLNAERLPRDNPDAVDPTAEAAVSIMISSS